jgi:hypothetical protein
MQRMRDVTIRSRADGVIELAPKLSPLKPGDRAIVIAAVLFVTGGLFLSGLVPAIAAAVIAGSCLVGDVVIGAKRAALALLRPAAQIVEVPSFERRRSGTHR